MSNAAPSGFLMPKAFVTVSPGGIVNGSTGYANNGADFGPDTTSGASAPGICGSPYSPTLGIQEAVNFASGNGLEEVRLLPGTFEINLSTPTTGSAISIPTGIDLVLDGAIVEVEAGSAAMVNLIEFVSGSFLRGRGTLDGLNSGNVTNLLFFNEAANSGIFGSLQVHNAPQAIYVSGGTSLFFSGLSTRNGSFVVDGATDVIVTGLRIVLSLTSALTFAPLQVFSSSDQPPSDVVVSDLIADGGGVYPGVLVLAQGAVGLSISNARLVGATSDALGDCLDVTNSEEVALIGIVASGGVNGIRILGVGPSSYTNALISGSVLTYYGQAGIVVGDPNISAVESGVLIDGCVCFGSTGQEGAAGDIAGILLNAHGSSASISNVKVTGCRASAQSPTSATQEYGISVGATSSGSISNVALVANEATGNHTAGVNIGGGSGTISDVTVVGNNLVGNGSGGGITIGGGGGTIDNPYVVGNIGYNPQVASQSSASASATSFTIGPYAYPEDVIVSQASAGLITSIAFHPSTLRGGSTYTVGSSSTLPQTVTLRLEPGDTIVLNFPSGAGPSITCTQIPS